MDYFRVLLINYFSRDLNIFILKLVFLGLKFFYSSELRKVFFGDFSLLYIDSFYCVKRGGIVLKWDRVSFDYVSSKCS